MELEKLFLTKQELPIHPSIYFRIPIHPKLLDENIKIDKSIAKKVFPQAAEEWHVELKEYTKNLENGQEKEWIKNAFLKKKCKVLKRKDSQYFNFWRDDILFMENGFVSSFCIDRDFGGTLYFLESDRNCISVPPYKFSEEKKKEFINSKGRVFIYAQHNINTYPGALFLRNWTILYMNEVFKQIFS